MTETGIKKRIQNKMLFLKELLRFVKELFFGKKPNEINNLKLVETTYFPPKGFLFCMWCGNIFYRKDKSNIVNSNTPHMKVSFHHEQIHLDQAKKYNSFIIFYLLYFWNWLTGLNTIKNSAYYTNRFEVEAYVNESDLDYKGTCDKQYKLKNRRLLYRRHKKNWKVWLKSYFKNNS